MCDIGDGGGHRYDVVSGSSSCLRVVLAVSLLPTSQATWGRGGKCARFRGTSEVVGTNVLFHSTDSAL